MKRTTPAKAMNNKKLFFISLFTLFLLISFDTFAKVYSFYYYYPNFDIIMHLLGGLSITTLAISILKSSKMDTTLNIFIVIICISILWEYVEFTIGRNILISNGFLIDTATDLLMDALGGIIAYICFHKIPNQKNLQK
jgi:uncharacterized membrane protein YjdF